MRKFFILIYFLLLTEIIHSQSSPNFQNKEYVFNNGSNPPAMLSSTNYEITLSSIGDGLFLTGMSSSNYQIDSGFISAYPPPGEVLNLRFTSKNDFQWDPEKSVGVYNVYKGNLSDLPLNYGNCYVYGLTTTSSSDPSTPPAGQCYFYLITAENRISEEGTMGKRSDGTPRANTSPCP